MAAGASASWLLRQLRMVSDIAEIELTSEPLGVGNEVILASAGTGKTQSLSARYLLLLQKDQAPERILATTFTRKAAGEIFERIFQRLAKSVHDDADREFLSQQIGTLLTAERCQELLVRLTRSLHKIRVGTLDSFFQQIALSLSPELGLPPAWEIVDEIDDERLRSEALRRMLDKNPVREVTELVHMVARGKAERRTSDTLMSTVNNLYYFYRDSLVQGDKAWTTRDLPKALRDEQLADVVETFAAVPMPGTKWTTAHENSCNAIIAHDWKAFLTKGIGVKIATGETKFASREITPDIETAYRPLIQHAVALLMHEESRKVAGARILIEKFVAEYDQLKIDREAIGFDDISSRLADMGRNHRDRLAYRMDAQLDHLLLDEFQDTSGTQWRAIRPFADRVTRSMASDGTFFCVGDVKQAIYGWRGGQAEILKTLSTQLENVVERQLVETYRCSKPVVDTVNQTFEKIPMHRDLGDHEESVSGWCREFAEHTAGKDHAGFATLMTGDFDKENQSDATFKSMARLVAELQRSMGTNRSIGVLVQKNKTVRDLIGYLRECDVWASQEGKSPITDSAAVQQILSACRLADNPGDSVARFHLAQGLLRDVEDLEEKTGDIASEFRRKLVELGYGVVVREWANILRPMCSERELRRLQQIVDLAFVYQSRLSDSRHALLANDFVDFVENRGISNSTSANVRVMVVHQAKGLEFDAVVVGELDRDIIGQYPEFVVRRSQSQFWPEHIFTYAKKDLLSILPQEVRKTQQSDLDVKRREVMCSLYVAMTRAKHALYMVIAADDPEKKAANIGRSIAGLLRTALTDGQVAPPNEMLYEAGDSKWYQKICDEQSNDELPTPMMARRITLKKSGAGASRGQEAMSPSQRSAGAALKGNDWFGRDRSSAMEYGSLIHAWFEQIEWLERDLFSGGPPEEAVLRQIAVQLPVRWINVDNAITDFYRMLNEPRTCNLLHQNAYTPEFRRWLQTKTLKELPKSARFVVRNEQPIVFQDDGLIGTGTIDRLVLVYVGDHVVAADVIDHKTDGAKSDADERKHAKFYGPQLRKYRDAVAEMFALSPKRIRMRLALLNGGRIAEVE